MKTSRTRQKRRTRQKSRTRQKGGRRAHTKKGGGFYGHRGHKSVKKYLTPDQVQNWDESKGMRWEAVKQYVLKTFINAEIERDFDNKPERSPLNYYIEAEERRANNIAEPQHVNTTNASNTANPIVFEKGESDKIEEEGEFAEI